MGPDSLNSEVVARAVASALHEDLGEEGDVTTDTVVPPDRGAEGHIMARGELVVAGLEVGREVFRQLDSTLSFVADCSEGDRLSSGSRMATVSGNSRPILRGERTALNFLMRMCGIATAARAAVTEIEGSGALILDTRKTAPGLRVLDKYAAAVGGARNHRMGLHDAVMIKDTHLAVTGEVGEAIRRALGAGFPAEKITAEVRTVEQLEEAIRAGAGRALLDNMDLDSLRSAVRLGKGQIVLEASGALRPGKLREVAETGVDFLSLGWLTHSAPSADVAMELEAVP